MRVYELPDGRRCWDWTYCREEWEKITRPLAALFRAESVDFPFDPGPVVIHVAGETLEISPKFALRIADKKNLMAALAALDAAKKEGTCPPK